MSSSYEYLFKTKFYQKYVKLGIPMNEEVLKVFVNVNDFTAETDESLFQVRVHVNIP